MDSPAASPVGPAARSWRPRRRPGRRAARRSGTATSVPSGPASEIAKAPSSARSTEICTALPSTVPAPINRDGVGVAGAGVDEGDDGSGDLDLAGDQRQRLIGRHHHRDLGDHAGGQIDRDPHLRPMARAPTKDAMAGGSTESGSVPPAETTAAEIAARVTSCRSASMLAGSSPTAGVTCTGTSTGPTVRVPSVPSISAEIQGTPGKGVVVGPGRDRRGGRARARRGGGRVVAGDGHRGFPPGSARALVARAGGNYGLGFRSAFRGCVQAGPDRGACTPAARGLRRARFMDRNHRTAPARAGDTTGRRYDRTAIRKDGVG